MVVDGDLGVVESVLRPCDDSPVQVFGVILPAGSAARSATFWVSARAQPVCIAVWRHYIWNGYVDTIHDYAIFADGAG